MKEPTLTFDSDNMNVYIISNEGLQAGSITINNYIDYSKYRKLNIKYTATLGHYSGSSILQLYKNHNNIQTYPANKLETLCYHSAITSPTIINIEIAQIENFNNFYIYIQTYENYGDANCNIYEVWLEK